MMPLSAKTARWLILLGLIGLSGCSLFSKKTGNEPMELVDFKETVKLDKLWSHGVGDGQSKGYTSLTPAIDGDNIYTIDYQGKLEALNATTGKKLWSKKINQPKLGLWGWIKSFFEEADANYQIVGGVGAGNGELLVSTYAGEVLALDEATGAELWRKTLPGEVLSVPQTNGSVVVAQTVNDKLYGFDLKTGKQLWFYDNPAPILTLQGTPTPYITDTAVYAGFSSGRLMAFNPTDGLILWEQRIALPKGRSELDRMVDIRTSPILRSGILYVGTYQGRIAALSRGTGSSIWGQDGSTTQNMALAGDKLFVSDSGGKVIAYNATSGEVEWTNEQLLRRRLSAPQVFGDYLAVVDFDGYMHILNQSDGKLVARKRVSHDGARAPMLSTGDTLYVYTNGGKLIAFQAKPKK